MLTLYLVCLILGGSLVAVSLLGGGEADADLDMAHDLAASGGPKGVGAVAARLLSLRNIVFFIAFFGLTGTLFHVMGIPGLLTPWFALGVGALAATGIHRLMGYLEGSENGQVDDPVGLAGRMAQVVVAIEEDRSGKIALSGGDRQVQLIARRHQDAEVNCFPVGERVVVVDVEDGVAHVAGDAFLA